MAGYLPDIPYIHSLQVYIFLFFKILLIFLDRREGNVNVWLPVVHPLLGAWPETQARALIGIKMVSDPLVGRPVHNPLSHTSQGYVFLF